MNKAIATANPRASLALQHGPSGFSVAPTTFHEVVEFAKDMCRAGTAIPKHLRENPGACMAVALQAFEWGMSPFAVANKSYSVNDRVAYEAQLIAAVVNTRSGLQGRLKYRYEGQGPDLRCTVVGILDGEEVTYRSPRFADITPKNSPLWKSDPEQQLGYYSARAWARRHVPEVILGVYDREEVEAMTRDEPDNSPPPAPGNEPAEANIVDVEGEEIPPAADPEPEEDPEQARTYGEHETLGDYMEALQIGLSSAKTEEAIEEIWNEFDPLATLEGDEDSQALAVKMKGKALQDLPKPEPVDDEPPSAGGLFRE